MIASPSINVVSSGEKVRRLVVASPLASFASLVSLVSLVHLGRLVAIVVGSVVVAFMSPALGQQPLYEASSGEFPSGATYGWFEASNEFPFIPNTAGSNLGSGTPPSWVQVSSTLGEASGYSTHFYNPFANTFTTIKPVQLDASQGYQIDLGLQILSENTPYGVPGDGSGFDSDDNGDGLVDRAGFSLTLIGDDLKGIELAFSNSSIWAQTPTEWNGIAGLQNNEFFIQGSERIDFDTSSFNDYSISISGDQYSVSANGSLLFSGASKDYTGWSGTPDVYNQPNLIFFGDNTTDSSSTWRVSEMTLSPMPEPASALLLAIGSAVVFLRRSRRSQ